MSYIKSLLFLFFLSSSFLIHAQSSQKAVYLKNGEILKGQIIEESEIYLKVEILGGSVFVVSKDNIVKIVGEVERITPEALMKAKRRTSIKSKFHHIVNAGFLTGVNIQNGILHGSSFQYVLGYEFKKNFDLGLGFGCDFQDKGNYYEGFLPIFIEGKGSLEAYFPSYFYSVQLGYSINRSLYFHPKVGYKFFNTKKIDLNVELGYVLQQVGYIGFKTWSNADPKIHRMYSYNRLVVRLSVHLKNFSKKSK